MKKTVIAIVFVAFFLNNGCNNDTNKSSNNDLKGTITIYSNLALYSLAVKWKEEFEKEYPNVKIDVSAGDDGKGIVDALVNTVDLEMVSRKITYAEIKNNAWFVAVAKDAVVPIVNANNPNAQDILNKGISRKMLMEIFISGNIKTWSNVVHKNSLKDSIKVYTRSDTCSNADVWAKYFNKKQENLVGVGIYGCYGLTQAIQNNKLAIGYNNIYYAYDFKTKYETSEIKIAPIDFNDDGIINDNEYFYQHRDSIVKAITDGRFPSSLTRSIYFICNRKPTNKATIVFLKWILTDGQKLINENGYAKLTNSNIHEALKKLN